MQILQQHPKYTYFYNYKFCYNCFLIMIMIVYRDYQPGAPAENRQSVSMFFYELFILCPFP